MLKSYAAKVLLLGEYTILSGSKALALPYNELNGRWSFEQNDTQECELSHKSLKEFVDKSKSTSIDRDSMRVELEKGLWFDSSIPHGFGLGSSGAVIAAIYDRFGKPSHVIDKDKIEL